MFNFPKTLSFLTYVVIITGLFTATACNKEDPEAKFKTHSDAAKKYQEENKLEEARIELQNALDLKPKDAETNFQMATVMLKVGKIPQAVEGYNSAVNLDPNHKEARLQLASIYLAAREYEQAENHINFLLDKEPEDVKTLTLKANLEGMGPRKDNKNAIEILKKLQNKEPDNIIILASRATFEVAENNYEVAEKLFKQAIKHAPDSGPLKISLAELLNRQGRLDEAQEIIEGVVEENPNQPTLRYVFGEFLLRRGLADKALEQYKSILVTEPKNIEARDRLYDIYLSRNQEDLAKNLLAEIKKVDPNDPSNKYFAARNLELEGKNREALAGFLDSLTILNNFPAAFRRAGVLEIGEGKVDQGIEHLNQALSLDQEDAAARFGLSRALFMKHEYAGAKENLERIIAKYPMHLAANVLRADIAIIENEPEKAEKVYALLLEAAPENPIGYYKRAVLEERKGNTEEAIEWYLKTMAFDTDILPAARRLVELRKNEKKTVSEIIHELETLSKKSTNSVPEYDLMIGTLVLADTGVTDRFEVARKHLNSAIEKNPKLIGAYFALAAVDSASGDPAAAEANYKKLLKSDPQHVPSLMMLALSEEGQKKYEEAAENYKKILEFAPEFAPAANNLSWLLAEEVKNKDLDEALRLAQIAKEQMPDESSVSDTLGWVHVLKGNNQLGLEYLEEAVEKDRASNGEDKANPEILYHLAKVNLNLGDKEKAEKAINQALKLAPDNHPKLDKFKELKNSIK